MNLNGHLFDNLSHGENEQDGSLLPQNDGSHPSGQAKNDGSVRKSRGLYTACMKIKEYLFSGLK
jgi:hypothetical protein